MRSPRRMPRPRRHVIRRHQLNQAPVLRIDHAKRGGSLGRGGGRGDGEGAKRTRAAGGIVVAVAPVKPHFVSGPHTQHVRGGASLHIENHVLRCGGRGTRRIPHFASGIEDGTAADEEILAWTDSEAGPQNFTGYVCSTVVPFGGMRTTPPSSTFGPICGMER